MAQNREKTVKKPRGPGKQFAPGNRVNPGGRPKIPEDVKLLFREASPRAIKELLSIFDDEQSRPGDKIRAAEAILNRAWGTPVQSVELANKAGEELKLKIEYVSKTK